MVDWYFMIPDLGVVGVVRDLTQRARKAPVQSILVMLTKGGFQGWFSWSREGLVGLHYVHRRRGGPLVRSADP